MVFMLQTLIPITAFTLGTWQVFRLGWKTELIAIFEDRLVKPPLPLPPRVDPDAIKDFDYRKVYISGWLRHDQEMLIGPRIHDGNDGYLVVTPLERSDGGSTVLVNRGWIPRSKKAQAERKDGLPTSQVTVEGLLREPWKKNLFTPDNQPRKREFYFPDVQQMAELTGSDAVWIEETMKSAILDTSGWNQERLPQVLPSFLEHFAQRSASLSLAPKQPGTPHTLIVTAAALRALDLVRVLKQFQRGDATVAKLFAKHIKFKDAVDFVRKTRMNIGVGTPSRINGLIAEGALTCESLERVVIDCSFLDQKKRSIFDMKETLQPLMQLLNRGVLKAQYNSGHSPIKIIFY
ncbi:MAG: hypothetical protein Q9208_000700 [Pyrenodesmia sp. 3 TL-2023]